MLAALKAAADNTIWSSLVNMTFGYLTVCFSLVRFFKSHALWSTASLSSDHSERQVCEDWLAENGMRRALESQTP